MAKKNWKKISEEYVLQTPWLSLRKDGYENPKAGVVDNFCVVERPDFVVIVPQTKENKFILVSQYRHGVENIILNFPMGFIGKGEKPAETAQREFFEETGFSAGDMKFLGSFFLAPSFTKTKGYVFAATGLEKKNSAEHSVDVEEIDDVVLVSQKELENLIEENKFSDFPSVCAYLLAKRKSRMR